MCCMRWWRAPGVGDGGLGPGGMLAGLAGELTGRVPAAMTLEA